MVLEAVATGGTLPPPSVKQLARNLKCTYTLLVRRYPELCKQIQEQYQRYVQAGKLRREREIAFSVESAVLRVHREGVYPSSVRVEALLPNRGWMRKSLARQVWRTKLRELGWDA